MDKILCSLLDDEMHTLGWISVSQINEKRLEAHWFQHKVYGEIKLEWETLRLSSSYGRFKKQSERTLPPATIRNFAVSQGSFWIEKHNCNPSHCSVFQLKEFHGSIDQN
jgi:hypothetical protein|tara:strand:- start:531 stop:857 length:327 start_codon:yes stop_codon:yes gene_type:complete